MPGSPLNITLPTVGVTTWTAWANGINSALSTIIADIEAKVVTAEINENANHAFNNYPAYDAAYFGCRAGNTTSIPVNSIGVKNGDWYATDSSGNEVRLTSGGALASSSDGGFDGDYVSAGASAYYDNGTTTYQFKDSAGNFVNAAADTFKVYNGASNNVGITYAGSTSYTLTVPSTLPAAVALVSMDASGNLSHSATIGTGLTFNNANLTLSGTSDIKHGDRTENLSPDECQAHVASGTFTTTTYGSLSTNSGAFDIYFTVPSVVGNRLKSVRVEMTKSTAVQSATVSVYKATQANLGVPLQTASGTFSGASSITVTLASPSVIAVGERIRVRVNMLTATGTNTIDCITPAFDRV